MNIFEILNNAFLQFVQSVSWMYVFTVIVFTYGIILFSGLGVEDTSMILLGKLIKVTAKFQKKTVTVLTGIGVAVAFWFLDKTIVTEKSLFMSFPIAVFFYDYALKWILDRVKSQFQKQPDAPSIPLNDPNKPA